MYRKKQKAFQIMRFCAVGVSNTLVDIIVFFVLTQTGVQYLLAQGISYSAGVANSFYFNRKWTFKAVGNTNVLEMVKFLAVNGLSLLMSALLLYIFHDTLRLDLGLSKGLATVSAMIINYMGSRNWVFKERHA